jgi:hypothetical protein
MRLKNHAAPKYVQTTNWGITLATQTRGMTRSLIAASFIKPDIGIAVGDAGTILVTSD